MANPGTWTIRDARLLTLRATPGATRGPRRGADLRELGIIERGWINVRDGAIEGVGAGEPPASKRTVIDARGRVVLPGFVDCHTHACYAGNRFDEADARRAGVPYLEILRRGGGIMSTVRATRTASAEELTTYTARRLETALHLGTTTIEVKSGYGLSPDAELRMLEAIRAAAAKVNGPTVVPTFLGAHAKDPDNPRCVEETIRVTLPRVVAAFPGIACDAYCEEGAWSRDECVELFKAAKALGCPLRVHADQFHTLGMTSAAVELGARSVDHLEATTPEELERLARSATIGVALPGCGFHLDGRYAPARALVDIGGALAVATNCNPGSSPTIAMPFVIALAVKHLGLTPAEAISAATVNAAHVLGLAEDRATIEVGKRADVQMLATDDERALAYEIAGAGPVEVWSAGVPTLANLSSYL